MTARISSFLRRSFALIEGLDKSLLLEEEGTSKLLVLIKVLLLEKSLKTICHFIIIIKHS